MTAIDTTVQIREFMARTKNGTVRLWLDDRDGTGRVVLLGYGRVWSYCWPRRNRGGESTDLAEWLSECDIGYVSRKFGAHEEFDLDETLDSAKRLVLDHRRRGHLDAEDARDWFDRADAIGDEPSAIVWWHDFHDDVPDAWESNPIRHRTDREFVDAFNALWPALPKPTVRRKP